MKVIISQEQNERLMRMIKQVAETYKKFPVLKVETSVKFDPITSYYILYPTITIDKEYWGIVPRLQVKTNLEDYVENFFGVDVVVRFLDDNSFFK